jgi:hypothetical protein
MTAAVEREFSNYYFFSFFFDVSSMGHSASTGPKGIYNITLGNFVSRKDEGGC